MSELLFGTIDTAGLLIKKKEISPVELTKLTLEQLNKIDSTFNAFITLMDEEAIVQAMELEEDIQNNKLRGPLHGIPIVVKDLLQTKGVRTTGGSKVFQDWVPTDDATSIQKLKEAGQ
jgi:aspartyl-tRNA(Asn)/glutamyl-tRNA(Gln) amidotransferase subunit A